MPVFQVNGIITQKTTNDFCTAVRTSEPQKTANQVNIWYTVFLRCQYTFDSSKRLVVQKLVHCCITILHLLRVLCSSDERKSACGGFKETEENEEFYASFEGQY